jgi:tRNA 2-thiouridine synthesizing protein C
MTRKRILCLQRQAPGQHAREGIDAALVASAFDQVVSLLFVNDGVYQLVRHEWSKDSASAELIASLPDYGVESIYACDASFVERGLATADLLVPTAFIPKSEQAALLQQQHAVLND